MDSNIPAALGLIVTSAPLYLSFVSMKDMNYGGFGPRECVMLKGQHLYFYQHRNHLKKKQFVFA
jgi:hypothetical protein